MKTLNGNIICKQADKKVKSNSTIILPELDNKYKTLEVVVPDDKGVCKEGDILYVPFRAATKVKLKGEDYEIINKDSIMFIV